jgi:hypothetical protein
MSVAGIFGPIESFGAGTGQMSQGPTRLAITFERK